MRIGVDFDNTIVCFDTLFHRAAREKKLIPESVGSSKGEVRDYLRAVGREQDWTALQGDVYGELIRDAQPFPGVVEFLSSCVHQDIAVNIISHKTKQPFLGSSHDLHKAAMNWLESQGFFSDVGLKKEDVYLELTKEKKMERIASLRCTHFVDDLPEFLSDPHFPKGVRRFLFDPRSKDKTNATYLSFSSWFEIQSLVEMEQASHLSLTPLKGGANNQTFKVENAECPRVLKAYFQHPRDSRDRLKSEFEFVSFAHHNGLKSVPVPLSFDEKKKWGFYEYVSGAPVTGPNLNPEMVDQAIAFFEDLNRYKNDPAASQLPLASEACFSLEAHLDLVGGRVSRLESIIGPSNIDQRARSLVQDELKPLWNQVCSQAFQQAFNFGLDPSRGLTYSERVLSPSDFGFHNALMEPNGALRFIDFEYAGWDDPAKTIVDFFCQPKVPVPMSYYSDFSKRIAACADLAGETLQRAEILLPVYRVKWACILLNEFLPVGHDRRRFAQTLREIDVRKMNQLEKVESIISLERGKN
ncbi:MAG: hypothetical protein KCHDKBKB_00441 [Elusimicrobia bacterium]|nr:hypothetical protein [Elusimicrobiota bacterium]